MHCAAKTLCLLPDLIKSIKVDVQRSNEFIDKDMLMTDQAYELVQSGVPFREAYVKVKTLKNNKSTPQSTSRKHSSSGSAYNLDLKTLNRRLQKLTQSK